MELWNASQLVREILWSHEHGPRPIDHQALFYMEQKEFLFGLSLSGSFPRIYRFLTLASRLGCIGWRHFQGSISRTTMSCKIGTGKMTALFICLRFALLFSNACFAGLLTFAHAASLRLVCVSLHAHNSASARHLCTHGIATLVAVAWLHDGAENLLPTATRMYA